MRKIFNASSLKTTIDGGACNHKIFYVNVNRMRVCNQNNGKWVKVRKTSTI